MNARIEAPVSTPTACPQDAVTPFQSAPREREREFGFGYGSSSGYGTRRRYTTAWGQARFRCA